MASKRRGGFRPPELRGTLGTLLRTTTDVVRGALERGAREGRARLDDVRTNRRRQDALAELGEIVLDLIHRGEIDLEELPEAHDLVRQLDELEDLDAEHAPPRAATRRRFDDRPVAGDRGFAGDDRRFAGDDRPRHAADEGDGYRGAVADSRRPGSDDGTVSSGAAERATRPTTPARPRDVAAVTTARAPTRQMKVPARPHDASADDELPADEPPRRQLAPDPHRKGGISFDDDDLADYMHPDDVPAKSPARDPGDRDP